MQLSQEGDNLVNFYDIFSCENLKNFCEAFFYALAFIFTYGFLKNFSRTHFCFHRQFLRYFHGRKTNLTDGKPIIFENFQGRDFDFQGEKEHCHHHLPSPNEMHSPNLSANLMRSFYIRFANAGYSEI